MNNKYTIKNITPEYLDYDYDNEGFVKFRRNKNGVICIFAKQTLAFGNNTIGLCDSTKVRYEDWIELRKHFFLIYDKTHYKEFYCIGGSDSGVLMGYSKYKTAEQLALEKKGLYNEPITNETQFTFDYGHANEELCAIGFHWRTGLEVVKDNTVFFNVRTGFMQANVDYFCYDRNKKLNILEIKTCNPQAVDLWADKEVPPSYYSQAVGHYSRCLEDLDIAGIYFCCMYSNKLKELIIRYRERDEFIENVLEQRERIFIDLLKSGSEIPAGVFNEPEEAVEKYFNKLYPQAEEGKTITLSDNEIVEAAINYYDVKTKKAALEKEARGLDKVLKEYKTKLEIAMEDASYGNLNIDGEDYILDMSNNAPRVSISKENLCALEEQYPDVYKALEKIGYIETKISRKFTLNKVKKKNIDKPSSKKEEVTVSA